MCPAANASVASRRNGSHGDDDERFLSLNELARTVRARAESSRTRTVESKRIQIQASRSDPERLTLILPGTEAPVAPTHWSDNSQASSEHPRLICANSPHRPPASNCSTV